MAKLSYHWDLFSGEDVAAMKFFVDTADPDEVAQAAALGICDGVTTNPTLVAKTGMRLDEVVRRILGIVDGPVSIEAISTTSEEIVTEARSLSELAPEKVVVKVPMTREGLVAVRKCAMEGIKTNVTLVFSPSQALLAAKAGATYVSPFIGRLDDASHEGMQLIVDVMQIYQNYGFETEVIVASIRHPMHVVEAARIGAHVATIPFQVLEKLFKHPLTDVGIERFLADYEKIPR